MCLLHTKSILFHGYLVLFDRSLFLHSVYLNRVWVAFSSFCYKLSFCLCNLFIFYNWILLHLLSTWSFFYFYFFIFKDAWIFYYCFTFCIRIFSSLNDFIKEWRLLFAKFYLALEDEIKACFRWSSSLVLDLLMLFSFCSRIFRARSSLVLISFRL